jgi:hypothetical protein
MPKKLIRFVAVLAFVLSLFGSSGVAHAAPSPLRSHSLVPSNSPALQPLPAPSLNTGPSAQLGVQFVHVVTAANLGGPGSHVTIISNALIDGNPNAIILVTPDYNPGGLGGIYDNHPIGVYYSGGTGGSSTRI